jgi:hypothetical protein
MHTHTHTHTYMCERENMIILVGLCDGTMEMWEKERECVRLKLQC